MPKQPFVEVHSLHRRAAKQLAETTADALKTENRIAEVRAVGNNETPFAALDLHAWAGALLCGNDKEVLQVREAPHTQTVYTSQNNKKAALF